jgi:hypothetical protein
VALVMGEGVAATEIGSAWFLLDQQLHLPASKLDPQQLGKVPLDRYTTIVLSGGTYTGVDATAVAALKRWVQAGGSLVTYGSASKWAIEQKLADGESSARKKRLLTRAAVRSATSATSPRSSGSAATSSVPTWIPAIRWRSACRAGSWRSTRRTR